MCAPHGFPAPSAFFPGASARFKGRGSLLDTTARSLARSRERAQPWIRARQSPARVEAARRRIEMLVIAGAHDHRADRQPCASIVDSVEVGQAFQCGRQGRGVLVADRREHFARVWNDRAIRPTACAGRWTEYRLTAPRSTRLPSRRRLGAADKSVERVDVQRPGKVKTLEHVTTVL